MHSFTIKVVLWACVLLTLAAQPGSAQYYERSETYGDVEAHFDLDSVGPQGRRSVALRLPGELNGHRLTFLFDTGSSVNVVSPRYAEALGLRWVEAADSVLVEGVGQSVARRAVADSLGLGNLTLRRVPFLVVSTGTGDAAYDQYLHHLRAILGRPLLEALGTVTFDFERHQLTAPRRPRRRQKRTRRSNLNVADATLWLTATTPSSTTASSDTLLLIPDFGATHSALGADYYQKNRLSIEQSAQGDTVLYAGIGGLTQGVEYTLHDVPLRIGATTHLLPTITVLPTPGYESRLGMDFFSRQRQVTFDLRRWRLTIR